MIEEPDATRAGGEVFETGIQMRWGDMDALGHLNNAMTARLLEELRIRFMAQAGVLRGSGSGALLARNEIDYLAPVHYSAEPVLGRLWIDRIGTSSFTFAAELVPAGAPVAVRAKSVIVAVEPDGSGSRPLDQNARALLSRYLPT